MCFSLLTGCKIKAAMYAALQSGIEIVTGDVFVCNVWSEVAQK
jgi:hypothetical protein